MVDLNMPTGIPARGNISVVIIPAADVTDINAVTDDEANGLSAINASLHAFGDGWARSADQQASSRRRLGASTSYEVFGEKTVTFDTARFVYDPQDPTAEVSKVYAGITEGEEYVILERLGFPGKTLLAADEYYDAYRVRAGIKEKLVPGDDGEMEFTVRLANLDEPVRDAQIVASGG